MTNEPCTDIASISNSPIRIARIMRSLFFACTVVFFCSTGQAATQPTMVEDADQWARETVDLIRDLNYDGLQAHLAGALDGKIFWTTRFGDNIREFANGESVVYVDLLERDQIGNSILRHVYAIYFGGRRFFYFSIEFRRGESGWIVMGIKTNSQPYGFLRP